MLVKDLNTASKEYHRIRSRIPLGVLRSARDYEKAVGVLDKILDQVGEDEDHPLAELAEALSVFIDSYEETHKKIPSASPRAVLKALMTEHGLKQSDLPELGTQGVVSEILSGKRQMNVRQIKCLAERFGVSSSVFV